MRPCVPTKDPRAPLFGANDLKFHDYCNELQRRLPIQIEALCIYDRAIVGIFNDPAGVTWNCALDLSTLIEVETALAARARALKLVTVH